ncbi:MAG: hypothetical protein KDD46_08985, partial [Bdellovibrionales bacterium]|nr:hypothetical protein [Bdellovibrionales bacterium]
TEVTSLTDKIAERKEQAEAGVNAKDAMNSEALAQLQPVTVLTQKDVGNLGLSRVVPSRKLDEVNKAGKSVVSWKDAEPILHNLDEEFTTYSSIDPSLWTNDDLAQVQDYLDFLVPVENNAQGPFKQELLAATKDKREKFSALAGLMKENGLQATRSTPAKSTDQDSAAINDVDDQSTITDADLGQENTQSTTSTLAKDHHALSNELAQLEKQLQDAKDSGATDEEISTIQAQIDAKKKELDEYLASHNNLSGSTDAEQEQSTVVAQQTPTVDTSAIENEIAQIDQLIAYTKDPNSAGAQTLQNGDLLTEDVARVLIPYTNAFKCEDVSNAKQIIDVLPAQDVQMENANALAETNTAQVESEQQRIASLLGVMQSKPLDEEMKSEGLSDPVKQLFADHYMLAQENVPTTMGQAQDIILAKREKETEKAKKDQVLYAIKAKEALKEDLAKHNAAIPAKKTSSDQKEYLLDQIQNPTEGLWNKA